MYEDNYIRRDPTFTVTWPGKEGIGKILGYIFNDQAIPGAGAIVNSCSGNLSFIGSVPGLRNFDNYVAMLISKKRVIQEDSEKKNSTMMITLGSITDLIVGDGLVVVPEVRNNYLLSGEKVFAFDTINYMNNEYKDILVGRTALLKRELQTRMKSDVYSARYREAIEVFLDSLVDNKSFYQKGIDRS